MLRPWGTTRDLLPGQLPAPAASQGAVGPAQRVSPSALGSL